MASDCACSDEGLCCFHAGKRADRVVARLKKAGIRALSDHYLGGRIVTTYAAMEQLADMAGIPK